MMSKLTGQSLLDTLSPQFELFEKSLNGQIESTIHQVRKKAFRSLVEKGFPSSKDEEYKFTNLTGVLEKNIHFEQVAPSTKLSAQEINSVQIKDLNAINLIFINGVFSSSLSDNFSQHGVTISTFDEVLKRYPNKIEQHFGKHAHFEHDAFVALNTAFSKTGLFLEIEPDVIVEKPVALYFIGNGTAQQSTYNVRNLITVGKSATVTLIEKFDTIGHEKSFTNVVSEISMAENSNANYFKIENDTEVSYHISNMNVSQARDSHFTANTIALNGAMVRNNLNIRLNGEGCEAHMNGLYVLGGKTHVDNHTEVDHIKPNAYSNELYKGIMDDESKGIFNGKIFVRQDAQKTNAFQSNKNILLTNDATVNTKPQLEIWADDVKCSHGCTTGQLDPDALFYLQARGIKKEKAKAMLLYAFAIDVIQNLTLEPIRDYVEKIIIKRLEK